MNDPFIITDDGDAIRASTILYVHFVAESGLGGAKTLAKAIVETEDYTFPCTFKDNAAARKERDRIIKLLKALEVEDEDE